MSSQKIPRSLRNVEVSKIGTGVAGLLSIALISTPVMADETANDTEIDEIVVEGARGGRNPYADPMAPFKIDRSASQKLSQSILDAAKSVTILPKEMIDDSGTNSFRDLMRIQPGVTLGTGEGGNAFGDRVFIRGFDARNDVYVDGLRDPGVVSREIFSVEQIEIFKGPSSVFGGRGTTGGAISMISKTPQNENFGDIDLTLGTADMKRVTIDVNRVITDDLSIRVNGMIHDSDTAGRDYVYNKRWGGSIAAAYKVSESVQFTFDYYHLESDNMPDWGIPYDNTINAPYDVDRTNFYGVLDRDFHKNNANIVTGKLEIDFSEDLRFQTVMRYGNTWNAYIITAPERVDTSDADSANWTVQAGNKSRNQTNRYIGNQTDLTWEISNHTVIGGVEFSKENISNIRYDYESAEDPLTGDPIDAPGRGNTPTQNLWNPDASAISWIWPLVETDNVTTSKITTKAFYLIDTIVINDKFQVFGGIRVDDYKVVKGELTNKSTFFNWHAGLTYKPASNGNIYMSYGSSSNPPGEQVDGGGSAYGGITESNSSLDPERNKSFELGTKWAVLDEHLLLTAALFRIDKTAYTTSGGGRGPTATPEVTTLDGKIRVDGVEFGMTGNVTDKLSVFGGVTLLKTKILKDVKSENIGKKLANIAETSFTIMGKYKITDGVDFGATVNYSSQVLGGSGVAGTTQIPGYTRIDAFANYKVNKMVSLSLNVQNLTDKVYYDSLYRSGSPFVYIAPGRSASVTIDIEF